MEVLKKRPLRRHLETLMLIIACILGFWLNANNIQVSNVRLENQNAAANTVEVVFNLYWENAYYVNSLNLAHDAAWVFVKFKAPDYRSGGGATNSGSTITVPSTEGLRPGMVLRVVDGIGAFDDARADDYVATVLNSREFTATAAPVTSLVGADIRGYAVWEHAHLANAGHTLPPNYSFENGLQDPGQAHSASNPVLGTFIHYNQNAISFTVPSIEVRLVWDYGANNLPDDADVGIQVHAIEMVKVPAGSFRVGDDYATSGLTEMVVDTNDATYYNPAISSVGGDHTGGIPDDIEGTSSAPLFPEWPNGYDAFYVLKYELSQGHYRDFLNTLDRNKQNLRTATNLTASLTGTSRNFIMTNGTAPAWNNGLWVPPVFAAFHPVRVYCNLANDTLNPATGEWKAMNYLSSRDLEAYLDWAALRPITEMEYEKMVYGPLSGSSFDDSLELAHGLYSTQTAIGYVPHTTGPLNPGQIDEASAVPNANIVVGFLSGANRGPLRVGLFATASSDRTTAMASFNGVMNLNGNLAENVIMYQSNTESRAYRGAHGDGLLTNLTGESDDLFDVIGVGMRGSWFGERSNELVRFISNSSRGRAGTNIVTTRVQYVGGRGGRTAP